MIYKNYIHIFNWKTKNKKCKTAYSERIKYEVVIICFTYLFVNIATQITFVNWSEPLVYIFFEFNEVSFYFHMFRDWISNMRTKLLSLYLAVLWTFTRILFGLCISHFVLWNISSMKAGFFIQSLETSNSSVPRCFTSTVHLPDLSRTVL